MRTLATILLLTIGLAACRTNSAPEQPITEMPMSEDESGSTVHGTGKIVFNDFEGGFYGIEADDGQKFYPVNLDDAFKEEGLRVRFELQTQTGVMSIVMWGTPVSVVSLERLKE